MAASDPATAGVQQASLSIIVAQHSEFYQGHYYGNLCRRQPILDPGFWILDVFRSYRFRDPEYPVSSIQYQASRQQRPATIRPAYGQTPLSARIVTEQIYDNRYSQ